MEKGTQQETLGLGAPGTAISTRKALQQVQMALIVRESGSSGCVCHRNTILDSYCRMITRSQHSLTQRLSFE